MRSVPSAVADGFMRVRTHPLPRTVLTSSKLVSNGQTGKRRRRRSIVLLRLQRLSVVINNFVLVRNESDDRGLALHHCCELLAAANNRVVALLESPNDRCRCGIGKNQ